MGLRKIIFPYFCAIFKCLQSAHLVIVMNMSIVQVKCVHKNVSERVCNISLAESIFDLVKSKPHQISHFHSLLPSRTSIHWITRPKSVTHWSQLKIFFKIAQNWPQKNTFNWDEHSHPLHLSWEMKICVGKKKTILGHLISKKSVNQTTLPTLVGISE